MFNIYIYLFIHLVTYLFVYAFIFLFIYLCILVYKGKNNVAEIIEMGHEMVKMGENTIKHEVLA